MELDGAGGAESSANKGAEDLQDGDGTRTIVIGAGGTTPERVPTIDRILMSTDNGGLVGERVVRSLETNCILTEQRRR